MKASITKQQLIDLYYNQKLSMRDIARKLGYGETVIHKYMNKFSLQRRSQKEALSMKTKSMEHRQKLAERKRKDWLGSKNPNWNGGNARKLNDRNIAGLSYWRKSVKRRDNFTCQICFISDKEVCKTCSLKPRLHVHHIKAWKDYPELRLVINNGITLCENCHRLIGKRGELLETLLQNRQSVAKPVVLEGATVRTEIMSTSALAA